MDIDEYNRGIPAVHYIHVAHELSQDLHRLFKS